MRAEPSVEGNSRQFHGGDALLPVPAAAARDSHPAAEGRADGPVSGEDAEGIGHLCFES